jgi:cytochrome c peroxidase
VIKFERPSNSLLLILLVTILLDVILWWPESQEQIATQSRLLVPYAQFSPSMAAVQPIPDRIQFDARKVELGRSLFHDKRLSADDTIACSDCHVLAAGGDDGLAKSRGIGGAEGEINAPTVFNSGFNFVQFWDGRAISLEEQIDGPVNNPVEMGSNWNEVLGKLSRDVRSQTMFKDTYSDGISVKNIKDAIATFERSLTTPGSRFDRYLQGDVGAMNDLEVRGFELFRDYGCIACHQGVNLGGNMYQQMGLMGDYFGDRGKVTKSDLGRYNVTENAADRHYFKVPGLRNVALTAPYFHDGSAGTLDQAVRVMARYQLGRKISDEDTDAIVMFLRALTGEIPRI